MAWRVLVIVAMHVLVAVRVFVMMVELVFMRMGMIVLRVGILAANQHARLARADAAAVYGIKDEGCTEVERGGGLLQEGRRDASVDEGAEQHVSTEPGEAF